MGHIYKRGKTFWIKYYLNGKPLYESSESKKWADAANLLKEREGRVASGRAPGIRFNKVMLDELIQAIKEDYKAKGQKRPRVKHLEKFFNGYRVIDVTTTEIKRYINHRREKGVANGTINRELAALKRMFHLGADETPPKVERVPKIPRQEEDNVKEGFFEDKNYHAILEKLPEYMKGPVIFAYWTGWRINQICSLTHSMIDIENCLVSIPGRFTKNKKPHTIYMNEPLLDIIKKRRSARNLGCKYVFHRNGLQVKDFRVVWNTACRDAGLGYGYRMSRQYVEDWQLQFKPGPTIHDFRRTAARNLVRSGVPENVAMKILGQKTRSIFDRYNIVVADDLKWAAEKQAESLSG